MDNPVVSVVKTTSFCELGKKNQIPNSSSSSSSKILYLCILASKELSSSSLNFFFSVFCVELIGPEALNTWNAIGSLGARNFTLCRKPEETVEEGNGKSNSTINGGGRKGGSLKAWINKSFSLKVQSH